MQLPNRAVLLAAFACAPCFAQATDEFLARLDRAAKSFHGVRADLRTSTSDGRQASGTMLLRRESAAKFHLLILLTGADAVTVVVTDPLAEIYRPQANQVRQFDLRPHRDVARALFAFLFGAPGADLAKHYDVPLLKTDSINGETVTYIEFVPKSPDVRKLLAKAEVWYSQKSDCPLRQKFEFPDGAWRQADFSNLLMNPNIPTSSFTLPKKAN